MVFHPFKLVILIAVALLVSATAVARLQAGNTPTHYKSAYDDVAPILQGIYDADHDAALSANEDPLHALVVPHHLTASATIARGLKQASDQSIKKILLLSPDHFFQCPTLLCTTNSAYDTFFGEALADPSIVKTLEASHLVSFAPDLFADEHGVFAVLPFIKYYVPDASVTPIVISQKWQWQSSQSELLALIGSVMDDQTLLILSSDFSHYLSLDEANDMDMQTQAAIEAVDLDAIASLDNADQSDCPNGLWLLAALAKERGFDHPSIIAHTNSATILDEPDVASTTSHFAITWSK